MTTHHVDVLVIGTGPAGGTVARLCQSAGKTVAMTDTLGYGGTCPLRGCEPKKLLVDTADVISKRYDMRDNGFEGDVSVHWGKLMEYKRSFTDTIPERAKRYYEKLGILTLQGSATFIGPNSVRIGEDIVEATQICIATGASPRSLGIEGEDLLATSDDFLDMETLPERILFIGAGFIAFEFAHVASIAGAKTGIVYRGDRVLRLFDADLADILMKRTLDMGIDVHLRSAPERVEKSRSGEGLSLYLQNGTSLEADMIVNGAGRVPALDGLALDAADVAWSARGVEVNEFLQSTTNSAVYAAGDVVPAGQPLTTTAVMQAQAVAHNMLHGNEKTCDYAVTPAALFTHPPLGTVGMQEKDAQKAGLSFEVISGDASGWAELKRIGDRHAGYKVLVAKETGYILGAHFLGHGAEEIVNIIALAMRTQVPFSELQNMLWAYPSFGYMLRYMK